MATCSPRNKSAVQQDGASLVFDYNDSNISDEIRDSSADLNLVFDTIGTPTSSSSAEHILTRPNAVFVTVRPGKAHTDHLPKNAKICDVFVFTAFPKEHTYRGKAHWPVSLHAFSPSDIRCNVSHDEDKKESDCGSMSMLTFIHCQLHQENVDLSTQFFASIPELLSSGSLKPRPVRNLGKLSAASLKEAMSLTKSGKVSNEKLTFTVKG